MALSNVTQCGAMIVLTCNLLTDAIVHFTYGNLPFNVQNLRSELPGFQRIKYPRKDYL